MTKNEEITLLTTFVESVPSDTYLRPWLSEILPGVCQDIRSDIIPHTYGLGAYHQKAAAIVADARTTAAAIVADTQKEADKIKAEAREWANSLRQSARDHLRRIAESV